MQLCAQHAVCMTYMEQSFRKWKHFFCLYKKMEGMQLYFGAELNDFTDKLC